MNQLWLLKRMEQSFSRFKEGLSEALSQNEGPYKNRFYSCQSFYSYFFQIFEGVFYPDFNYDTIKMHLDLPFWIYGNEYSPISDDEYAMIRAIIPENKSIPKNSYFYVHRNGALIESTRGSSYMFLESKTKIHNPNDNSIRMPFEENHYAQPKFLIRQIDQQTYIFVFLQSAIETPFNAEQMKYSFGISKHLGYPSGEAFYGIGEVWFFSENGLEFSRISVLELFNNYNGKEKTINHKFGQQKGSYIIKHLDVDLFQLDSFLYKVKVEENAYAGRLKERWSGFSGIINFKTNQWFDLKCFSELYSNS